MPEIPDWVSSTRPEHIYQLVLFESGGASAEEVDMSRDEYIALKAHLAAMRGYLTGTAEKELEELQADEKFISEFGKSDDAQQAARHLQIARIIYRLHPDAVVFQSAAFDEQLEEIAK